VKRAVLKDKTEPQRRKEHKGIFAFSIGVADEEKPWKNAEW